MTYDAAAVEKASRDLLIAIGEDPEREGLIGTPDRMARAWREMCSGLFEDPREHLRTQFHAGTDELVLVRDITFHSVCEHHLLPFYGRAHVGYIPRGGVVTGLSKLARLVEGYARRPQVQERLTGQVGRRYRPRSWIPRASSSSSRRSTCACRCAASPSRARRP